MGITFKAKKSFLNIFYVTVLTMLEKKIILSFVKHNPDHEAVLSIWYSSLLQK